jgi:hypothetical protein
MQEVEMKKRGAGLQRPVLDWPSSDTDPVDGVVTLGGG